MPFLSKDHVEVEKFLIELPKATILIVSFFATAAALVLRGGASDHGVASLLAAVFGLNDRMEESIASFVLLAGKLLFLFAIFLTVDLMYACYNFISQVAKNVTTDIGDKSADDVLVAQVGDIKNSLYPPLRRKMDYAVVLWGYLLAALVLLL